MKLPRISGMDVVKVLSRLGYVVARRRGSHVIMENAAGQVISVPNHPELDKGMLRRLIRDAKLNVEDFVAMLK